MLGKKIISNLLTTNIAPHVDKIRGGLVSIGANANHTDMILDKNIAFIYETGQILKESKATEFLNDPGMDLTIIEGILIRVYENETTFAFRIKFIGLITVNFANN